MRKIILSIVLLFVVGCGIFVGFKTDGFKNFDNVFDSVYDKVDKYNPFTSTTSDTDDNTTKYLFYNESRKLRHNQTYISYRHKYSEDFNDVNSDSLYYIEIDANLTTNYEFVDFSFYYGEQTYDSGMFITFTRPQPNNTIVCKFQFGEYIYSPENPEQEYEFEIEQNFEQFMGQYYFYLVFDSKNQSITLCHFDESYSAQTDKLEQALKFPIITLEKNNSETAAAYDCLNNLFDNRETPFFFNQNVIGQNSNMNKDLSVNEYYKSSKFVDLEPRAGYTFKGFYYDEELTQPYTGIPVKPIEELYQKWEINKYSVILDCRLKEEPDLDLIEKIYSYGEQVDYVPSREGYDFIGWINDATNADYNTSDKITSDLYLRAKWDTHKLKVTYLDEDESFLYEQRIEIGGHATYVPKKVGYKFAGWKDFSDKPIFDEETTLIATWVPAECVVTLYINNNVYKVYKVGYGQALETFLNEIGIKEKYIAKYAYADLTGSNIPINKIELEKDMRIDISDSFVKNKEFVQSINENKKLIVICCGLFALVVVLSLLGAIFDKKKKKR